MLDRTSGYVRVWAAMAIVVLAPAIDAAGQNDPQDYPQWRGRNRDGAASAFTPPEAWPESLTLKWKVGVGSGYATPLVIGDRVFAFTRRDGSEIVMALDATTGNEIWSTGYPAPYKMQPGTEQHGEGPWGTPLFHNNTLYTVGISGIVSAFDAVTGKLMWQTSAPAVGPLYGTAMSPVADRDVVIVHVGGHDSGALTAFDASTGKVQWAWSGDGPGYGSPVIAEIAGTRQVITETQEKIVGVDLLTGALLWERELKSPYTTNSVTPVIFGDVVIYSTEEAGIIAIRPLKEGTAWSTETVWETTDAWLKMSSPVMVGDTLFGLSSKNSGQYFAIDARTGEVLWLGQPREADNTAIVTWGDLVFLLNDDAQLTVARGSRMGLEPVRRYTVADGATYAQPTITGDRIFIKDVDTLALWSFN